LTQTPSTTHVCLRRLRATGVHYREDGNDMLDNLHSGADPQLRVYANAAAPLAGQTSSFLDTTMPIWSSSICFDFDPTVPVCFEIRDKPEDNNMLLNSGCALIKFQRATQHVALPPARTDSHGGGAGSAHVFFSMPDLRDETATEGHADVIPTLDGPPHPRDVCVTGVHASLGASMSGRHVQLWAYSAREVAHNSFYEAVDEAKARARTGAATVQSSGSGAVEWTERVCLRIYDDVCFEVHDATDMAGVPTGAPAVPLQHGCATIDPTSGEMQSVLLGDGSASVTFTVDAGCRACAAPTLPTLVVLFYQRDLCKMKYTAKSIAVNGIGAFSAVIFAWLSDRPATDYQSWMDEFRGYAEPCGAPVHIIDFSPYKASLGSRGHGGWVVQQLLKLAMAYVVTSDHYVVFDAKNAIIRPLGPYAFVSECNQARIAGEFRYDRMPWGWHQDWHHASAWWLGVESYLGSVHGPEEGTHSDVLLSNSVSPIVMNRQTILALHEWGWANKGGGEHPNWGAVRANWVTELMATLSDAGIVGGAAFSRFGELADATEYLATPLAAGGRPWQPSEFTLSQQFAHFVAPNALRCKYLVMPFARWGDVTWSYPPFGSFDDVQQHVHTYAMAPDLQPDLMVIGIHYPISGESGPGTAFKYNLHLIFQRAGILLGNESPEELWPLIDQNPQSGCTYW